MVDDRTDSRRGANNDVMVTDVRRRGEKLIKIDHIHDQRDAQSGASLARKLNWQKLNQ